MLAKAVELYEALFDELLPIIPDGDFELQCFFQPLPAIVGQHGVERGGNILGIDRLKGNNVILLGTLAVNSAELEVTTRPMVMEWKDALEEYGNTLGLNTEYIYMNYADGSQDVLNSYGTDSVRKMEAVSQKYDPEGVFQTRVSGPYKLFREGKDDL